MERLDGKCVLLGISGGIAAYKMASVAGMLKKSGRGRSCDHDGECCEIYHAAYL